MKKVYMQPQTAVFKTEPATLIAESWAKVSNQTIKQDEILVKGDRGSRTDYNVWNEDWSK